MNDQEPKPRTILIESRYWAMNARLLESIVRTFDFQKITRKFEGLRFNGSDIHIEVARHPLDNYSEETLLLRMTFDESVLTLLAEQFLKDRTGIELEAIELWLTDLETMCSYTTFSIDPETDIQSFENNEMGLVDLFSSLQPDLEKLFRLLETEKVLSIRKGLLFGAPQLLRDEGLQTPDYSYLYCWHFFFPHNPGRLAQTIAQYGLENESMMYAGARVYMAWGLLLWETAQPDLIPEEMVQLIFIDTISSSESVVYSNTIYSYTGFLDLIIQNKKVDCNYIRNVCNINHLILQRIKQWNLNLSVEQQAYHVAIKKALKVEEKIADFNSSESILLKAIEGVDVKESQKSGHIIELALSIFTALSLYSICNDFYTIITTENPVIPIHWFSLRTVLIIISTVTMIGFLWLLRRKSRR